MRPPAALEMQAIERREVGFCGFECALMMDSVSPPLLPAKPETCALVPRVPAEARCPTGSVWQRADRRGADAGIPLDESISISLRSDLLSHLWNLEPREGELKGIQLSRGDWFCLLKGILERSSPVENPK